MKESLSDMMKRVNDGMPSEKWINTSVGVVNMGNKNAAELAAVRLLEKRAREAGK